MRFVGTVYRAHNPRWSFAPLSGEGAARYGGRFNPVGLAALYTSRRMEVAWLEAQLGFAFKTQPLTLVTYEVDCDDVVDLSDPVECASYSIAPDVLGCGWEDMVSRGIVPPTWVLARRLVADGVAAIVVPSFARGAKPEDRNVVFYRWAEVPPHQVLIVDDEQRLPKNAESWRDKQ